MASVLLAAPRTWPTTLELRRYVAAWLFAGGMAFQLAGGTINQPHFVAALALYVVAFAFAPKRWPSAAVLLPVWLILGSAAIATIGADLRPEAISALALVLAMAPLVTVDLGRALDRPFALVVALVAFSIIFQVWQTGWQGYRIAGMATNPNHAAGVLVLCSAYLLRTPYWWVALIGAAACLLTGSRLGIAVLLVVMAVLVVMEQSPGRRWLLLGGLLVLAGTAIGLGQFLRIGASWADTVTRLDIQHVWSLWPEGPVARRFSVGVTHSVPLLVLQELGLVAALSWCFVSLRALWRTDRRSPYFFGALAVIGLSTLDVYTWLGAMMAPWWLFIAADRSKVNG